MTKPKAEPDRHPMPTLLREAGYRFFFYSNEGDPLEPPHGHASAADKAAKVWLDPVELARSRRMSARETAAVLEIVIRRRDAFLEAWNAHFHL